jgi:cold-inducible RNA-binding protein
MVIFVGNLSRSVTEEQLKGLFEPFGEVKSVRIIKDKLTGQPRGFAFVDMPNNDEAQQAMTDVNNQEVDGRQIRLNEAREQEPRAPRPMGERRSYGGGNGGYSSNRPPRRNNDGNGGGYSNRF